MKGRVSIHINNFLMACIKREKKYLKSYNETWKWVHQVYQHNLFLKRKKMNRPWPRILQHCPIKKKGHVLLKKRALKRCNSPVKRRVHSQIKFWNVKRGEKWKIFIVVTVTAHQINEIILTGNRILSADNLLTSVSVELVTWK